MQNQDPLAENVARRAERYLKENDLLLRKHKLVIRLVINFPRRFSTPLFSRIALWIVSKQGGQLDIQFGDIRKK
jgi:hypothetical protein